MPTDTGWYILLELANGGTYLCHPMPLPAPPLPSPLPKISWPSQDPCRLPICTPSYPGAHPPLFRPGRTGRHHHSPPLTHTLTLLLVHAPLLHVGPSLAHLLLPVDLARTQTAWLPLPGGLAPRRWRRFLTLLAAHHLRHHHQTSSALLMR